MRWIAPGAVLLLWSCGTEPVEESFDEGPDDQPAVQRYDLSVADVWKAAEEAVLEDEVTIERRRRNERGGALLGRRVDGRRMKLKVRPLPGDAAEAVVWVEPGNRELAGMVQSRISEKLSLSKARADLFGQRSVESAHAADLRRCMEAAEKTCRALDLEVIHKQLQESGGRIEARDQSGRMVRITLQPAVGRRDETGAVLTADGAAEGSESELLGRVRREFERQLFPVAE